MGRDGKWHFTPTYDYTFTVDPNAPHYIYRHSMMINGKIQAITRKALLGLAKKYNIKLAESSIEKAIDIIRNYQFYGEKASVSDY